MAQEHIAESEGEQTHPTQATMYFGKNQIAVEYGGEVSTMDIGDTGKAATTNDNVAPNHDPRMLTLAKRFSELRGELYGLDT